MSRDCPEPSKFRKRRHDNAVPKDFPAAAVGGDGKFRSDGDGNRAFEGTGKTKADDDWTMDGNQGDDFNGW